MTVSIMLPLLVIARCPSTRAVVMRSMAALRPRPKLRRHWIVMPNVMMSKMIESTEKIVKLL